MDTPLGVCEGRDVKGLYRKARRGEIKGKSVTEINFKLNVSLYNRRCYSLFYEHIRDCDSVFA